MATITGTGLGVEWSAALLLIEQAAKVIVSDINLGVVRKVAEKIKGVSSQYTIDSLYTSQ